MWVLENGRSVDLNNLLAAWGKTVYKLKWAMIVVWVAIAIAAGTFSPQLAPLLTGGGWGIPNTGSYEAYRMMGEHFESRSETAMTLVIKDAVNQVGSVAYSSNLKAITDFLLTKEEVESVYTWLDAPEQSRAQFTGEGGNVSLAFVDLNIDEGFAQKVLPLIQQQLTEEAERLNMEAMLLGAPALWGEVNALSQEGLANAHLYAIPIILLVLILVFRSLVSVLTPLVLAVSSIMITMGILYFIARESELSVFIMDSTLMLGIGISIDFALIFVARFREELALRDKSKAGTIRALSKTMHTAGHAILFSSLTIIGSMSAILFVEITAVRSMALGIIVVVFVLMLASLSLLPALLAILGYKVNALRVPFLYRKEKRTWYTLAHRVMRRPLLYLIGAVLVLGAAAWPALNIQTSTPDVRMLPEDSPVRNGAELVQEEFGLGFASPIHVVVQAEADGNLAVPELQAFILRLTERIEQLDHVDSVTSYLSFIEGMPGDTAEELLGDGRSHLPAGAQTLINRYISRDNGTIVIDVMSDDYASSEESKHLVEQIRTDVVPTVISDAAGLRIAVGGETAEGIDVSSSLRNSLIEVTIFTLCLIFIVLVITFRSVLMPFKAILLNLLSLGATYGILIIVFQWGGGSDIFGFGDFGYIQNFVPILLLGLLFSLSTDYEVFLLTRIKEEYDRSGDNAESVATGLHKTAPMISGAAIIMIAVFSSFAFAGILPMQQLGLGMAVAILLDVTIVRLILVPATMKLLGSRNWWFPFRSGKSAGSWDRSAAGEILTTTVKSKR